MNKCKRIVFFGGLIDVAKILKRKGYVITFVDYTQEMVNEAKKKLTGVTCLKSDMRDLHLKVKQDAIVLMGRIMTYMYTDKDVLKALGAFKKNLKSGGLILIDNYETGKIGKGNYFNGQIVVRQNKHIIRRLSKIAKKQAIPTLYMWRCIYQETIGGEKTIFRDDNHILRSFTKKEMEALIKKSGLHFVKDVSNFERRSFITIAKS